MVADRDRDAARLILQLVRSVAALPLGAATEVVVRGVAEEALVERWCAQSGNTLIERGPRWVHVARGRTPDPIERLPEHQRPGFRLWIYTNFHCNLACDYCCVRSSPSADPRALPLADIAGLAAQGRALGVREIYLTGGEPMLRPDVDEVVNTCAAEVPTTLLTNGMLFKGARLDRLAAMSRDVRLQISLDSATSTMHDAHRGPGTWARTIEGIRTALGLGFVVRVAATLGPVEYAAADGLRTFLGDLGITPENHVIRQIARQGFAEDGLGLARETLLPEVTVTAEGVYWHPVAADDDQMRVSDSPLPLAPAFDEVLSQLRAHRMRAASASRAFPCA